MVPFNKYIVASLLRGRTPELLTGSLRAIGLAKAADMDDYADFMADKSVKRDIKKLKDIQDAELLMKHLDIMEKYNAKDFLLALALFNDTWTQCWDMLSVVKYRLFVIALLTAGYDLESIIKEFNIKFSVNYTVQALTLLRDYYWDVRKLNSVERITACENVVDNDLRSSLLAIVDGKKYEGIASSGAKRLPEYENILEEILADAYAHYKKYYKKKDPNSRAQLKVWLDVIIKIGDRHNKLKPKNTDELDALIKKLEIEKNSKHETPSVQDFIKKNELA